MIYLVSDENMINSGKLSLFIVINSLRLFIIPNNILLINDSILKLRKYSLLVVSPKLYLILQNIRGAYSVISILFRLILFSFFLSTP